MCCTRPGRAAARIVTGQPRSVRNHMQGGRGQNSLKLLRRPQRVRLATGGQLRPPALPKRAVNSSLQPARVHQAAHLVAGGQRAQQRGAPGDHGAAQARQEEERGRIPPVGRHQAAGVLRVHVKGAKAVERLQHGPGLQRGTAPEAGRRSVLAT